MPTKLYIGIALLVAPLWAQLDTRVSPAPVEQQSKLAEPQVKWIGAPLSGFLSETLGSNLKEGLESTVAVSESANNQPALNSGVDEVGAVTGTMSLHHEWARASVLMQYAAGANLYVKNSQLDNQFHQFAMTEAFRVQRWNLSLSEQYGYLPQSSFGFDPAHVIGGGVASDGGASPGVNLFLPLNIIERTIATQASAQYVLGARSSITLSGSFNDLHFSGISPGLNLADSQMFGAGAQYTLAINGKNSIGAGYNFSQGRGIGVGSLIQTHSATANYTRRIGNRLTLRASAGPQFTTFYFGGVETSLGAAVTISAGASYQAGRSTFDASYFRGTNPGTGAFLGSQSNDVRGSVGRQFGRSLHASVSAGYGQNENLGIVNINAAQQIDSTYVSASLERSFGSRLSGYVSDSLQNQDVSQALCNSAGCTQFPMMHFGTIGLRFHIHPLTLRP
jgi:hypothetical protein